MSLLSPDDARDSVQILNIEPSSIQMHWLWVGGCGMLRMNVCVCLGVRENDGGGLRFHRNIPERFVGFEHETNLLACMSAV